MTKRDKREFHDYCMRLTDAQLRNVYAKERLARRSAYAAIALSIINQRGTSC